MDLFHRDSWTMDIALSKYQYTRGKRWYFKKAEKEKRWDYQYVQNSQIYLHIGCVHRYNYKVTNALLRQAPKTMQKVVEWI